jgi:hypothetical protein
MQYTMFPSSHTPQAPSYFYPHPTPTIQGNYTPPAHCHSGLPNFQNTFQSNYVPQDPQQVPVASRLPLSDTTGAALNWATPQNPSSMSGNTKRKQAPTTHSVSSKRRNTNMLSTIVPTNSTTAMPLAAPLSNQNCRPMVPGAGPQLIIPAPGPSSTLGSLSEIPSSTSNANTTNVYYFVRGLKPAERPAVAPISEKRSTERPGMKEYSHLGCILYPYVSVLHLPLYTPADYLFRFSEKWMTWKMLEGNATIFDAISRRNTSRPGLISSF